MAPQPPPLHMSQIIASDAPLLSPVAVLDAPWDAPDAALNFNYAYYNLQAASPQSQSPPDPAVASKVLKMRMSPDSIKEEQEPLCLPTHQVFDLSEPATGREQASAASRNSSLPPVHAQVAAVSAPSSTASKRSASPATGIAKKRATERVSSKDFIPPDVSGLSKREARLVKNRAAAFLSRQRKREEFENMEIRVAELEQENARLLALTKSGSQPPHEAESGLASEVEQLRAQLAAAQQRERELSARLQSVPQVDDVSVKVESHESYLPASPSRSSPSSGPNKTAASFGLMVLLCALPTLLSMPMQSATSFSVPSAFPSSLSSYDYKSNFIPGDFDWARTSVMDMDLDDQQFSAPTSIPRKLEFADAESELGNLGGLDISFDTSSTDNGKIRVRIHPSSSASSRAGSPGATSQSSKAASPSPMDTWSDRSSFSSQTNSPLLSSSADPFLGIDYSTPFNDISSYRMNDADDTTLSEFGLGSEYSVPDNSGGKRRVRIALKTPPSSTSEGGEWEVQIC